jgi:hypothetical protein
MMLENPEKKTAQPTEALLPEGAVVRQLLRSDWLSYSIE